MNKNIPSFVGLPQIPAVKHKISEHKTYERELVSNAQNNSILGLSKKDKKAFKELTTFYTRLGKGLNKIPYSSMNDSEIEKFKKYVLYVFPHVIRFPYNIYPPKEGMLINGLFRAVKNPLFLENKYN